MILGARPWSTTVAVTFAPSTRGEPTFVASPSVVAKTSSSTDAPTSFFSAGTRTFAPCSTRNCLPPVLIIANDISFVPSVSLTHHGKVEHYKFTQTPQSKPQKQVVPSPARGACFCRETLP